MNKIKKQNKKVFVSGCFDLFHSGHLAFLMSAATLGDLYVSVGSDKTIKLLKREPIFNEKERLGLISSISCVKKAFVARGLGLIDFLEEFKKINPDFLVVNEDGDSKLKRDLCESMKIKYIVLKRKPLPGLPERSTSGLIKRIKKYYQ